MSRRIWTFFSDLFVFDKTINEDLYSLQLLQPPQGLVSTWPLTLEKWKSNIFWVFPSKMTQKFKDKIRNSAKIFIASFDYFQTNISITKPKDVPGGFILQNTF